MEGALGRRVSAPARMLSRGILSEVYARTCGGASSSTTPSSCPPEKVRPCFRIGHCLPTDHKEKRTVIYDDPGEPPRPGVSALLSILVLEEGLSPASTATTL
eukprot:4236607-Amphidinium_carterae.1